MTSEPISPDAVRAAQDTADLLDAWGEVSLWQGREGQSKDMAKAATAMRDLATAYLALAEKNERLRKRVDAADRLAELMEEGPCPWRDDSYQAEDFWQDRADAVAAYRATEERG